MEIVQKTTEKIIIRMDANHSLANSIRRSVDEIPILAVDEVEIFKNDSALYDEVLAHRIGLVPLKTDKKMNSKTELQMKLVKKGPGWVYSGDFKGDASVVYSNIPITLLEEGQEIEIVATAKLGRGVDHSKHSPGLCYYRDILSVKSNKPEVEDLIKKSRSAIKPSKQGSAWICDLDEATVEEISKIDQEAISDSGEILLFLESYGSMDASEILAHAINVLNGNLAEFEKAIA